VRSSTTYGFPTVFIIVFFCRYQETASLKDKADFDFSKGRMKQWSLLFIKSEPAFSHQ
jgi:hypothetical protein